jgi:hypothetical protein
VLKSLFKISVVIPASTAKQQTQLAIKREPRTQSKRFFGLIFRNRSSLALFVFLEKPVEAEMTTEILNRL